MCVRVFGLPKCITAFKLNKMFYDVHFYQRCVYNLFWGCKNAVCGIVYCDVVCVKPLVLFF